MGKSKEEKKVDDGAARQVGALLRETFLALAAQAETQGRQAAEQLRAAAARVKS